MPDYVFFGHGGRGDGTATGTYVVPKNCTVHFFEKDGQLLNMAGAKVLLDWLLRDHPYTAAVQAEIAESFGPYSTIPNYTITGDAAAATACDVPNTGIYLVGRPKANGPAITLGTGVKRRLSDVIGGAKGAIGINIYWMCCRHHQQNTNAPTQRVTSSTVSTTSGAFPKARDHVISDQGLTPSQVIARGGKWR